MILEKDFFEILIEDEKEREKTYSEYLKRVVDLCLEILKDLNNLPKDTNTQFYVYKIYFETAIQDKEVELDYEYLISLVELMRGYSEEFSNAINAKLVLTNEELLSKYDINELKEVLSELKSIKSEVLWEYIRMVVEDNVIDN